MSRRVSHRSRQVPDERSCVIYTRQSRARDGRDVSCQLQKAMCLELVHSFRWPLLEQAFDDVGESSRVLERPALVKLLALVESGQVGIVVVYSLDRLSRRLSQLHQILTVLQEFDVELKVLTDPHFGSNASTNLITNVVAAAAEFYYDITQERLADARAYLKRNGRRVAGCVAFGYRTGLDKQLTIYAPEAAVVTKIFELAAAGSTAQEIADLANHSRWGHPSGVCGRWTSRQVLKLLQNVTYTGRIRNGESDLPGCHAPIVSDALFQQAAGRVKSRRCAKTKRGRLPAWDLRGKIICSQCGRVMSTSTSHRKHIRYRYYRCRSMAGGKPRCVGVNISAYQIEQHVIHAIADLSSRHEPEAQKLGQAWGPLGHYQQSKLLAKIVEQVVFDPVAGKVRIHLMPNALEVANNVAMQKAKANLSRRRANLKQGD